MLMTYTVYIKKQAKKTLQHLSRPDRNRITEKMMVLGMDPNDDNLDIQPLQGQSHHYRLRVGEWRVIFDKNDEDNIINIQKVSPRGGAYK